MTTPVRPAPQAPARPVHRRPVLIALMTAMALAAMDTDPDGDRVQGWLSSVWGISAVIGPALGASLAQYASWRWIFLINS